MSHAHQLWASVTVLAVALACSATGINLGDNSPHGSGGSANEGDAAPQGSGGSEQGTGGAAHPSSGGTKPGAGGADPATGGASSGGTSNPGAGGANPASGGSAQGTGGMPDCSTAGCGQPPICGQSCDSVCGCCGCDWNDHLMVDGSAFQCASDRGCYSPAIYKYVGLATGAFRFAIVKRDAFRNVCYRIIMGTTGAFGPYHVTTSPGLWVEAAYAMQNLDDCESVTPAGPAGATFPLDITGHVLAVRDDKGGCTLDLDAEMYLDSSSLFTEKLISPPIELPTVACQQ